MGWFDEQLRERNENDKKMFEEALYAMSAGISPRRTADELNIGETEDALDELIRYYHFTPDKASRDDDETTGDEAERMEQRLRSYGIMYRRVELDEKWYKDSYDPLICRRKDGGDAVFLRPGALGGYIIKNGPDKYKRVGKKEAQALKKEAFCFYRPLPQRSLKRRDILNFLRDCIDAGDVLFFMGLALLWALAGSLLPRIVELLTSSVADSKSYLLLWATAAFILSVLVSQELILSARSLALERIEVKFSSRLGAAVISRMISLPSSFFRNHSSGDMARRIASAEELSSLIWSGIFQTGVVAIASLVYVFQMFSLSKALAVPALIQAFAMLFLTLATILLQMKVTKKRIEYEAKEKGIAYALISGIQKIRLAGAERRAFAKWGEMYSKEARLSYAPPVFLSLSPAIATAISLIGQAILYYTAVKSGVSASEYVAFSVSYGILSASFLSLAGLAVPVAGISPLFEMIEPLMEAAPESAGRGEVLNKVSGSVELNHVNFRYNDKMPYILKDVSLKIRPGEYIAIVGKSGCGKSTLLRMLLGFEVPWRGQIYYDGHDIRKIDLRSLRRRIGTVTQDGSLFSGDIFSNIAASKPSMSLDEAWEAAELAGIADDIRSMPMGMHTVLSEGKGGISGGQRQRLLIARAIAPKPAFLMFDEATSALDNITQKRVADALESLNCTRLVIAHRLSTIKNCDRILVLNEGRIAEDGTYDELLEKDGIFADLVKRQRLEYTNYVGATTMY